MHFDSELPGVAFLTSILVRHKVYGVSDVLAWTINCNHIKSCPPPVKQYITTHRNTEVIVMVSPRIKGTGSSRSPSFHSSLPSFPPSPALLPPILPPYLPSSLAHLIHSSPSLPPSLLPSLHHSLHPFVA